MIAPQWPHMRRSMATVLAELDYRDSAWSEHEAIAAQILAGNAKAAEAAALAHAQTAGRMTEERLKATTRRRSEPHPRSGEAGLEGWAEASWFETPSALLTMGEKQNKGGTT